MTISLLPSIADRAHHFFARASSGVAKIPYLLLAKMVSPSKLFEGYGTPILAHAAGWPELFIPLGGTLELLTVHGGRADRFCVRSWWPDRATGSFFLGSGPVWSAGDVSVAVNNGVACPNCGVPSFLTHLFPRGNA